MCPGPSKIECVSFTIIRPHQARKTAIAYVYGIQRRAGDSTAAKAAQKARAPMGAQPTG